MSENEKALADAELLGSARAHILAHVRRLVAENERLRAAAAPFVAGWEKYRAAFVAHMGREPADGEERNVFSPDLPLISDCRRLAAALEARS